MLGNSIIEKINTEQLQTDRPQFTVGDTIAVLVRVIEGGKERLQTFQGVVIAKRSRGVHSSFIVRKISHGVGVERTFQLHSRQIQEIKVVRTGLVRQSKIYYMRERSGKSARIQQRFDTQPNAAATAPVEAAPAEAANVVEEVIEQTSVTESVEVDTKQPVSQPGAEQSETTKEKND